MDNEHFVVNQYDKLLVIEVNRPAKKNAFTPQMIEWLTSKLTTVAADATVTAVAITGVGDYFTSGNDLNNFFTNDGFNSDNVEELLEYGRNLFQSLVQSFIDFPKVLVCVVNGHAVGMGVTLLPLFDFVYAVHTATFWTPFVALGQVPEGCSSYTFPLLMGSAKANNILLAGTKIGTQEAKSCGLITDVFAREDSTELWKKIQNLSNISCPEALSHAKVLMRSHIRDKLTEVNAAECAALKIRWASEEFMQNLFNYMKRSKL